MSKGKFVDFKELKSTVPITQILDHYGLMEELVERGDQLSGCCPIHEGTNPTQFRVSMSKNIWNCFSGCGGGNILDLVCKMEGVGIRDAALSIQEWFSLDTKPQKPPPKKKAQVTENKPPETKDEAKQTEVHSEAGNQPLGFVLKSLDSNHEYLIKRGLSDKTIIEFGLGYCKKGIMRGRIAIPIHSPKGELLAYAGRWAEEINDDTPKYKLPKGFEKTKELFNLHRAIESQPEDPLVLVEGFFDCMKVWQSGYEKVIALMGSAISNEQEQLIDQYCQDNHQVILLFDEDKAGREGREQIASRLAYNHYVRIIELPSSGIGPSDCSEKELREILSR